MTGTIQSNMQSASARPRVVKYLGITTLLAFATFVASLANDLGAASVFIYPVFAILAIIHHIVTWRLVVTSGRRTLLPSIIIFYIFILAWLVGSIFVIITLSVSIQASTVLSGASTGGSSSYRSGRDAAQSVIQRLIAGLFIQLFLALGGIIMDIMTLVELHRERRKDEGVSGVQNF